MLNFKEYKIYGDIDLRGYWTDNYGHKWTLFASGNIVDNYNTWRTRVCGECNNRVIIPHLGI